MWAKLRKLLRIQPRIQLRNFCIECDHYHREESFFEGRAIVEHICHHSTCEITSDPVDASIRYETVYCRHKNKNLNCRHFEPKKLRTSSTSFFPELGMMLIDVHSRVWRIESFNRDRCKFLLGEVGGTWHIQLSEDQILLFFLVKISSTQVKYETSTNS